MYRSLAYSSKNMRIFASSFGLAGSKARMVSRGILSASMELAQVMIASIRCRMTTFTHAIPRKISLFVLSWSTQLSNLAWYSSSLGRT